MSWTVVYAEQALKDAQELDASGLKPKAQVLLADYPTIYFRIRRLLNKLVGYLDGTYSRRFNIQRPIVYEVFGKEKTVRVLRMWTHYE